MWLLVLEESDVVGSRLDGPANPSETVLVEATRTWAAELERRERANTSAIVPWRRRILVGVCIST